MQTAPNDRLDLQSESLRGKDVAQPSGLRVQIAEVGQMFPEVVEQLHPIASLELAGICLHDPLKNSFSALVYEKGREAVTAMELPMENTTAGWVWRHQEPLNFPDVQSEPRFSDSLDIVREMSMHSFCEFPLTTRQRHLGTLSLASSRPNGYGQNELNVLRKVAPIVALSVETVLRRSAIEKESARLQMHLEISSALVSNPEISEIFPAISASLHRVLQHDHASITLYDRSTQSFHGYALSSSCSKQSLSEGGGAPLKDSPAGRAFLAAEPRVYSYEALLATDHKTVRELLANGMHTLCCIPMITQKGPVGSLNLASRRDDAFTPQDVNLLSQIAGQIGIALDNAQVHREMAQLKDKLAAEKRYLQGEIHATRDFEAMVGESPVLKEALHKAQTVANSDATVLILGETGTGKELLAHAIHRMSSRKDSNFIKLNCAAIPTGLLESELFGHEKGAFTGAISQKIGRLELADKGTLLLDEVGDIPLELQPKLLRVLQDREFERLGSTRTIRVNIRLIAATNRDLVERMEEGEFRSDLYYRINVFPIRLPSVRERRTDIPLLVRYFVQKFSAKMGKPIDRISEETMNALENYEWQGNIRELENFIERSVILSDGPTLQAPLGELITLVGNVHDSTLVSLERDHILRVLRECGGVISGKCGAAVRLGVKRTTLQSMLRRFNIRRTDY